MIEFYFNSTIQIVSILIDGNGKKNETISLNIPCRIENYNRLVVNSKGEEVMGDMKIRFSPTHDIKYGDYIKVI